MDNDLTIYRIKVILSDEFLVLEFWRQLFISVISRYKVVVPVRFGVFFFSLFNGISLFVGNLMPKPYSKKNSGSIYPIAGRIRKFIPFQRVFARK